MQTKQQIERLLGLAGVNPNHRLGQNFLIDLNLMSFLVDCAGIHSNDTVFEVGCGTGSLTEGLAESAGAVVSVEYDNVLARIASEQLKRYTNVTIVNADVLENKNTINEEICSAVISAQQSLGGRILLVSNLPYNVGSSVMANLITGPLTAQKMCVTIQKEVAQRCTAEAGSEEYGTLSILMAAAGKAKVVRKLKPSVFWPRPQVESAMMTFDREDSKIGQIHDMSIFREVVSLFMSHRRKMLKACVKFAEGRLAKVHDWGMIFREACAEPQRRGEELGAPEYISMANLCSQQV